MKRTLLLGIILALPALPSPAADRLAAGFADPPAETKPWCYWYWISDNMSREGITRDLEAMARVGIGEALVGNIFLDDVRSGQIKVLSPEWWDLVAHAIREGGRTGVNIGMFNCPGWSQSGGPWIRPEQSMRYLAASEARVTGPGRFTRPLPAPNEQFQEVAVLAFPAPQEDDNAVRQRAPRVTGSPAVAGIENIADGDPATAVEFPGNAGRGDEPFVILFELDEVFTARSLRITPANEPFGADCELQAVAGDGSWQTVRRFKCDRSNMSTGVGFMPRGPVSVSFPATSAKRFRTVFTGFFGGGKPILAEVDLAGAARLESYVEKQLGKMHPTPLPMWDTYLWRTQPEPDSARLTVPAGSVQDITKEVASGGQGWEIPPGEWIVQRIGMTPTGMKNSPASPEGQGLEVDKMNRALAEYHFRSFIGELLRRMPPTDRKAFKRVVADSYEMGSQNWTDGFALQFRSEYGYDPNPWLPVLSGRLVGSADQSERFLWDLRRLIADRVATEYVGGLREASKAQGLGLWLENYGHWGFPSEFLKYGSESDRVSGEYWVTGDLGSIELRAASSCANTYGKKFVSAESFTGGPPYRNAPRALKARGDWAFCEGVNHFVLHVYIHQPWEDKVPGINAWFGTEFDRHNTWFGHSKAWVDYLRRCSWLLQQGTRVADVAYFIGEDAPKMTGARMPELPAGRDFDYINADVIERFVKVKNGLLTLPHGTTYRVLVLPELETMRPELLRRVHELVKDGATVLGPPPSRSPSRENYPHCDAAVKELASRLWGNSDTTRPGERALGKGRIVWRKPLEEVLASPPDFESSAQLRYTHRRANGTDIYFVANPKPAPLTTTAAFRAGNRAPELWWPDSGRIERAAVYEVAQDLVRLPLSLGPNGSVFIVFRAKAAPPAERIVTVTRDGQEVLTTKLTPPAPPASSQHPKSFTFAVWAKATDATTLVAETNRGVVGLSEKRNEVFAAPHGDSYGGGSHAGCGLAVGTNGVCVLEHGANYFVSTLVHAAAIGDWTHVTVVYEDGQPRLYLDGKLVRTGLRSERTVHSGAGGAGADTFRGRLGGVEQVARALSDEEVVALARAMPRPGQAAEGPPIELVNEGRHCRAVAALPGIYELVYANGKRQPLEIREAPGPEAILGAWEVRFAPGWGAPERTTFEQLMDWTGHPDLGIKYFSGKATYSRTFDLPPSAIRRDSRVLLDLGEVRDLATVRVNGREFGTLWLAPWRVDITEAVRPGANAVEIEVVNAWNNRLVGDQRLPPDQRRTTLITPTVNKDAPLMPAGLLGPVTLRTVREHTLRPR